LLDPLQLSVSEPQERGKAGALAKLKFLNRFYLRSLFSASKLLLQFFAHLVKFLVHATLKAADMRSVDL
jgi:hypothetical protein